MGRQAAWPHEQFYCCLHQQTGLSKRAVFAVRRTATLQPGPAQAAHRKCGLRASPAESALVAQLWRSRNSCATVQLQLVIDLVNMYNVADAKAAFRRSALQTKHARTSDNGGERMACRLCQAAPRGGGCRKARREPRKYSLLSHPCVHPRGLASLCARRLV